MDFDSTMIEKKSLEIFSIINKKEIQKEKVIFELIQLNGISNKIYRGFRSLIERVTDSYRTCILTCRVN